MNIKQSLLITGAALTVGGASLFGVNAVSAKTTDSSLAERIASRFSIDQTEVEGVIDEVRAERQAERLVAFSERLQEQVDAGTITAEQKILIEERFEEFRAEKTTLKGSDLTREEMKEQFQELRSELSAWADENGIDLDVIKSSKRGQKSGSFTEIAPTAIET